MRSSLTGLFIIPKAPSRKTDPEGSRILSIVGTAKVTFDVLFNMLVALGLDYKVVTRRAA